MAMYPVLFITNRRVDYIMFSKDNRKFHTSPHVTATTLLLIGIIITSGTLFAFPLELLNQNHAAMAQVQQQQQPQPDDKKK